MNNRTTEHMSHYTVLNRIFFMMINIKKLLVINMDDLSEEDRLIIHKQITADNRRAAIVWSSTEIVYWLFCLFMSLHREEFRNCRAVYTAALAVCVLALVIALIIPEGSHKLVHLSEALVMTALLGAGIGISCCQPDVRTIVMFASVLLVPIMFVSETLRTTLLLILDVVAYSLIGPHYVVDEIFKWSFSNLIIFCTVGIAIGFYTNRTKLERYVYARSAEKLADMQMRYAYYDQMTGLKNRRAYSEHLKELENDMPEEICVIMMDINGLKQTNDTMGHDAGDELIMGASECLQKAFIGIDSVYRIGGDEFCVIMKGTIEEAMRRLGSLDDFTTFFIGDYIKGISLSYGLESSRNVPGIRNVVKAADQMMYENKRNYYISKGRDRRRR